MPEQTQRQRREGEARVFLVEDHPILREGLQELISRAEGLAICGEAETAETAMDAICALKPDRSRSGTRLGLTDVNARGPRHWSGWEGQRFRCPASALPTVVVQHTSFTSTHGPA